MTGSRLTETRMLNLLRNSDNANKFAHRIAPRHLSPEGMMIFKTIIHVHTKAGFYGTLQLGEKATIKLKDVKTMLGQLFPGRDLEPLYEILIEMKNHRSDFLHPAIVHTVFDEEHTRIVLGHLINEAQNQITSHAYDLDRLKEIVTPDQVVSNTEIVGPDYTTLGEQVDRNRISIGLPGVDANLQGGIGRGELGVVGAAPKVGKTHMLINLAGKELRRGYPVLYLTLADLQRGEILLHMACWLLGVGEETILQDPRYGLNLQRHSDEGKVGKFMVLDLQEQAHRMTADDLHAKIATAKAANPDLRMVIVDRAEMMAHNTSDDQFRHRVMAIYRDLRRIAQACDVAIWSDSQTSDQGRRQRRVTMDMGHESKVGKAQILDIWIGIGKDSEEKNVRYFTLEGRRKIKQDIHRAAFNVDNYRYKEQYHVEDD